MSVVKIEGFAHNAKGIAFIDKKVIFVDKALPGEIVDIEITQEKKDYAAAEIKDIIEISKYRKHPECLYYGICGGCDFQHAEYDYQLKLKKDVLKNILKRIGNIEIDNVEIVASNKEFNYRRRAKFHCLNEKWGFLKEKSSHAVEITGCSIVENGINGYIKNNKCTNKEIILSDNGRINPKNIILNLSEIREGLYLTYRAGAFVQVNADINIKVIKKLISEIEKEGINSVLDLFGGIGNFSIPLALFGKDITNVEIDKKALDSFVKNVKRLGLEKKAKAVRKNLNKDFELDIKKPECVIIDPPRSGAKIAIKYLTKIKPEFIFYVSCEPSTLARDLKELKNDYIIKKVALFDMFPQTHHFETFVKLSKKVVDV